MHTQQSICKAQTPSLFQRKKQGQNSADWLAVMGWWTELSQSQVWFVTESKSPFPIFYMVHVSNTLLITGMVPCECNTFLYKERPTFNVNPKTSGQLYGNCFENNVNGICGCYVNPGSSCHDAKPSVIGAPYRWSVEACKFREEQKLKGQSSCRKSSACSYQI